MHTPEQCPCTQTTTTTLCGLHRVGHNVQGIRFFERGLGIGCKVQTVVTFLVYVFFLYLDPQNCCLDHLPAFLGFRFLGVHAQCNRGE